MVMDFEKMAQSASALLYDETGSPMPAIVETRLAEAFAAAFAAGREAMRDEAVRVCETKANRWGTSPDAAINNALEDAASAIRALPGKEGE